MPTFWETVLDCHDKPLKQLPLSPAPSALSSRTVELAESASPRSNVESPIIPDIATLDTAAVLANLQSRKRKYPESTSFLSHITQPGSPLASPTSTAHVDHTDCVERTKRTFACHFDGCSATFSHVSSKYRHIRTVHEGRRDHRCQFPGCSMQFGERSGLSKHIRTVHEGRRDHKCTVPGCDRRFAFRLHLAQHVSTVHLRQKVHVCDICNGRFGQRSSLTRHRRTLHARIAK